jgi:hypothetical protein
VNPPIRRDLLLLGEPDHVHRRGISTSLSATENVSLVSPLVMLSP